MIWLLTQERTMSNLSTEKPTKTAHRPLKLNTSSKVDKPKRTTRSARTKFKTISKPARPKKVSRSAESKDAEKQKPGAPSKSSTSLGDRKRPTRETSVPKSKQIVGLLSRAEGATIGELMKVTGWQAHSVRGFLAGALKKRQGLLVRSEKDGAGVRRYRIVEG